MIELKKTTNYKFKNLLFIFLLLKAFIVGNLIESNEQLPAFEYLSYTDVFIILFVNLLVVILWLVITHLGLFPIFCFNFVLNMVTTGRGFNDLSGLFFRSSLSHGVGELLVCYIIFSYYVDYLGSIYNLYKTGSTNKIVDCICNFLKKDFLLILIILLVSAVLEVFVSNRILIYLYERSLS